MTAAGRPTRELSQLAKAHGVQLGYTAQDGRRVRASAETLEAVLTALGHAATTPAEIAASLAVVREQALRQPLQPVLVQRADGKVGAALTVGAGTDLRRCSMTVTREEGQIEQRRLSDVATGAAQHDVADDLLRCDLDLTGLSLPAGYHQVDIDGLSAHAHALLLVPPPRLSSARPGFGVFAPLYALRGRDDWGVGNFSDLAVLADTAGRHGGELVGTLPLFAAFFRDPVDPSPYLPVSRLFWNELYIDVEAVPEIQASDAARALVESTAFQADLARLRDKPMVEYAAVMSAKRRVLEQCAAALSERPSDRRDQLDNFVKAHPDLERYADFRAVDDRLGGPWQEWASGPGALPDPAPGDAEVARYHRYVQFVAAEQVATVADRQLSGGAGLYLDLPVGVHPDGYDTWANPRLFAPAGVGAPPDAFFSGGQSWGFPPLHPEQIRLDGYRYLIEAYRHVLNSARAIRIDHILGLQRLFWIPAGRGADAGAYVRYRSDELRAIITLEASRAGALVIGEDLGTVSPSIRQAMDRDGILHSFVYQFDASPEVPLPQPRRPSMASLGSHDLPKFAAFWRGEDIAERADRGLLDPATAIDERDDRDRLVAELLAGTGAESPEVADRRTDESARLGLRTCLGALASGPAAYLLVDLADLELDTMQDNRPGTGPEADNWRWRLSRPLAEIAADRDVGQLLSDVRARRSTAAKGVAT